MAKTYEEYIKEQSEKMKKGWKDAYGNWVDADKYADPEWRKEYFARNEQLRNKQVDDAIARGELAVKDGKVYQGGKVIHEKPKTASKPRAISASSPSQSTNYQDYIDQINDLYNQQEQARLAALKRAREAAIGTLNQQKASINPMYQGYRNQTDAQHMQAAQRLRELMAAQGLTNSGDNVSANVALQAARQNALNDLNLQQQQAINQINQQIANVNNSGDEQAILAEINAARANALMDAQRFSQDMALRQQELDLIRQRNEASAQQWQSEQALREAEFLADLTGFLPDGTPTNRYQQQQLENAWMEAESVGYVTDKLAKLTGLPKGTPTLAAKELEIARQRENRIANSSGGDTGPSINQLISIWRASGRAPAGIPGVTPGTPYYDPVTNRQTNTQNNGLLGGFRSLLGGLGNALSQYQIRANGVAGPLPSYGTRIDDEEILRYKRR